MKRSVAGATLALILLCCAPAAALASKPHKQVAPPGNSGVSEYQEDVPTASGGQPVQSVSAPPAAATVLAPSVRHKLDKAGKTGLRVKAVATATAPSGHSSQGATAKYGRLLREQDAGVLESLSDSLGGSGGGLGIFLPLLLAASVIVVAAVAFARRRGGR